ncbi:DNA-binding IclR family transcriptional regulator [Bradyrhizobium sp. F1.6.2]
MKSECRLGITGSPQYSRHNQTMARKSKRATADDQITEATSYGPPAAGSVKSAGRVLRVLEFFDEIQRDARVAEVAERLGFPQSSTSILLNCLVELGYMDYLQESRSFLPSPRVTLLGTWLDKGPVRNGSLMRMLEELSHKTGDTVIIAARSGIYAQYIHVLQARATMRFHVPPGSRRLVVWSATGFSLLTSSSDKEIRSLCTRTNAEAALDISRIDINQVLENVERTRREGFFFSAGLVTPGAGSIAVPLPEGIDGWNRALAGRGIWPSPGHHAAADGDRHAAQRCRAALSSPHSLNLGRAGGCRPVDEQRP